MLPSRVSHHTATAEEMVSTSVTYSPASNLPFLFELLARVVQARLLVHLNGYNLLPCWQSAYRQFHETAVTKVFNDLLMTVDREQMSVLCLLDLSAAFNTVNQDLLLQGVERQFGLRGRVLQWVRSYLSGRTFRVVHGDVMSFVVHMTWSVPRSSVSCFSFCTWLILRTGLLGMACLFILMLMTHSCTSTFVATKLRHSSTNLSAVSWISATGCPPTD